MVARQEPSSQIEPPHLPKRLKLVVGQQSREYILRIEVIELLPESVPFEKRGIAHPRIVAIRNTMVVGIPVAISTAILLDGKVGIETERTIPVIGEHRSSQSSDGVLP